VVCACGLLLGNLLEVLEDSLLQPFLVKWVVRLGLGMETTTLKKKKIKINKSIDNMSNFSRMMPSWGRKKEKKRRKKKKEKKKRKKGRFSFFLTRGRRAHRVDQ
jgi:hypothetical protein